MKNKNHKVKKLTQSAEKYPYQEYKHNLKAFRTSYILTSSIIIPRILCQYLKENYDTSYTNTITQKHYHPSDTNIIV